MSFGTVPFGAAPFGAAGAGLRYEEAVADSAVAADIAARVHTMLASGASAGEATSAVLGEFAPYLRERITAAASLGVTATLNELLADSGDFADAIACVVPVLVEATGEAGDLLDTVRKLAGPLLDTVQAAGIATSQMHAQELVVGAAVIESLVRAGYAIEATSTAEFADALVSTMRAVVAALAEAEAADSTTPWIRMTAIVADTGEAEDAAATNMRMTEALADGVTLFASLRLGDGEYVGWVLNTATRAATEYTNYPFTSMDGWRGRYFGTLDTGLYELDGDDDDGDPIEASVRTGLMNMGTQRMKRLPSAYIGVKSSGGLALKVVTTEPDGAKVQDWYELTPRASSSAHHQGRIKLGRGLKSVYWSLELVNQAGADFQLDVIELFPMFLDRRL